MSLTRGCCRFVWALERWSRRGGGGACVDGWFSIAANCRPTHHSLLLSAHLMGLMLLHGCRLHAAGEQPEILSPLPWLLTWPTVRAATQAHSRQHNTPSPSTPSPSTRSVTRTHPSKLLPPPCRIHFVVKRYVPTCAAAGRVLGLVAAAVPKPAMSDRSSVHGFGVWG